jgi:hypothetical protein
MTIARLAINIQDTQNTKLGSENLVKLVKSQLQQILWHSQAYGTIFSVMLLTFVSLIFLGIHWTYRRFFLTYRTFTTNEWDISTK